MKWKLIFFLVCISTLVIAQQPDKLLIKIQNKFNSLNDFSAKFEQILSDKVSNNQTGIRGKFFYRIKNNFRIEMGRYLIVCDGTTLWNFDSKLNRVVINDLQNDPSSFRIDKYILEYPSECDLEIIEKSQSNSEYIGLKLIPRSDQLGFTSAVLYSDEGDMVRQIEILDDLQNHFIINLYNIELNSGLSNLLFTFNPPEGTDIVDLR